MCDTKKFFDDRIRKLYALPSEFEITEEWLRNALDEIDANATKLDPANERKGKKLLTHKEAMARLARVRAINV